MSQGFFGPDAWGPLVGALQAFVQGDLNASLTVHADEGEADPMPASIFFRTTENLRDVDREAIRLTRGRALDVGAGVGSVTLILQDLGIDVTAVEVIPEAVEIMLNRGVKDARVGRIQDLPVEPVFDSILLLMNGVALAGTLTGLPTFLRIVRQFLAPGGHILVDSTDLLAGEGAGSKGDPPWGEEIPLGEVSPPEGEGLGPDEYPGEVQYQLEFRGERGAPFPQLFVDQDTLGRIASDVGLDTEVEWESGEGEYLAVLTSAGSDPDSV